MLGLIASAAMRDQAKAIAADLPARRREIGAFVADSRRLTEEVRRLSAASAYAAAPAKIRETVNFLDEYLSLSIAEQFAPLLGAIRAAQAPSAAAAPEDSQISELIARENAYRVASGYPSVADQATVWGFNGTERPGAVYLAAVLPVTTKKACLLSDLWSGRTGCHGY